MLRSDFTYTGKSKSKAEFVETVNQLARLINGFEIDLGVNGGTDVAQVEQTKEGLKIDLTALYIPMPAPEA